MNQLRPAEDLSVLMEMLETSVDASFTFSLT